ncbi:3-hydroxyacyl-CoA dehydrogenase NAD-binding domain-containing protein [Variovorax sp. V116]|uniref:3-hydroxyacyl-CoA dehydrogenase NAD-binding domain-containing protein n=1 Tax=Variovorax sp. V116 TaxID=3065953 RepID=UPI0034E89BDB
MIQQISRALVIGAGNMGAGIAAQLANAGVQTVLLDRVLSGESSRNCLAERAIERQMGGGGFMHPTGRGSCSRGTWRTTWNSLRWPIGSSRPSTKTST